MSTTSIIGQSQTYTSVTAWDAAWTTGGWIGQINDNGSGGNEIVVSSAIGISDHTAGGASATNFTRLETAAGKSFRDHASVQTNPLAYDSTKGIGIRKNTNYNFVLVANSPSSTLRYLQVKSSNNVTGVVYLAPKPNVTLDSCIVESATNATSCCVNFDSLAGTIQLMTNCCLITLGAGVNAIAFGYSSTRTVVNCTLVAPSTLSSTANAIQSASDNNTVKNCAIFGFAGIVNSPRVLLGSNNASDLAIGFGTSNQASKTYANQFQTITTTGRDFRTKAGADLLDNGVTDTTNIPSATDIVGTARPQGAAWDIGCWELVAAAGIVGKVANINQAVKRAASW